MSLVVESEDGADEPVYLIEGSVTDSLTRPITKPTADGPDEEQDTKGQPGWWFLMANRGFRPLIVTPPKAPFPNRGKRRLTLQLSYGKSIVMRVRGLFDFNVRPPPDNAKIHVDRNHPLPRTGSEVSSSQGGTNGSQGTPTSSEPSDNLFLRTHNYMLTAVRLFAPYAVLVKHPMLSSWLEDDSRLARMFKAVKQDPVVQPPAKRQRLPSLTPIVKEATPVAEQPTERPRLRPVLLEPVKRPKQPTERQRLRPVLPDPTFKETPEVKQELPRALQVRWLGGTFVSATPLSDPIEIDVDDSPVQPTPPTRRTGKTINPATTTTTTSTATTTTTTRTPSVYDLFAFCQPTTTTQAGRRRLRPKPSSSDLSEDELQLSPDEYVESKEEKGNRNDDDSEDGVIDGKFQELDLNMTPHDLGLGPGTTPRRGRGRPKGSTNAAKAAKIAAVSKSSPAPPRRRGRPRLSELRDQEQEEEAIDVVKVEVENINQRRQRRSTKKPDTHDVSDSDADDDGDVGGQKESSVTEALLAPAMPSDVFVWHGSQHASQLSQNPTETVEEIDSSQFVLERDLLGSGSFARVYKAQYKGIDVAVKVFKPSESATRIDNELRILSKLRGHINVVRVVGYCVVNDHKQIAMEFCAFGNLHERIQSLKRSGGRGLRRRMTERARQFQTSRRGRSATTSLLTKRKRGEDDAAEAEEPPSPQDPFAPIKQRRGDIIVGIARGMQHLHNHNVCHRDLSSMNVLVDSNWVPKIADFGLSTVDVNEMKGMGVGTNRWRAPEVFKNKPKKCQDQFKGFYTNSSDVYSFAIIVWELFHLGEVPWEGELDNDVKRRVMQGERPKIASDVPRVWRKLIEQCWVQDPDRRPSFANIVRYLEANGFGSSSAPSS